ncbi:MAG: electron transport complex subunit E [Gammaproteobacteria bacterium]|nr:electron transport complex subunit E [Gammaproteobacteria bacterium]
MSTPNVSDILYQGLWKNNPGLVQLLGLCPLLAVSNTFINALGMGMATTLVLTSSNFVVALSRPVLREEIRIAIFVLVIAGFVGVVELVMNAYFYELYLILGIFIPLIVTNCIIIGRAEAFASRQPLWAATLDGFVMGLGFTLVLLLLGSMREIVGSATLFADAHLLFGEWGQHMSISFGEDARGILLFALPPGAFIGLGLLVAIKNVIDEKLSKPKTVAVQISSPTTADASA